MVDNKYVPIRDNALITVGALGTDTVVGVLGPAIAQDVFITRADVAVALRNGKSPGGGPFLFGIADANLSDSEIGECLLADGPLHARNNDLDEIARRRVQTLGVLTPQSFASMTTDEVDYQAWYFQHNCKTTYREDGDPGWKWWVLNLSDTAIPTGSTFKIVALMHGRWQS